VDALDEAEWLQRSAAWRAAAQPGRAIRELERVRWQGAGELARRHELARAHLDAGSSMRALRVLPSGRRADSESLLLRAEALRRQGWGRFPRAAARSSFASCLEAARAAAGAADLSDQQQVRAWSLALECATEGGDAGAGLRAWQELARAGWDDDRREWLGRRLGVVLAQRSDGAAAAAEVAAGLPVHARCLRYWSAPAGSDRRGVLEELAHAPMADLYGQWARAELGTQAPQTVALVAAASPPPPPRSVQNLRDWGLEREAVRQWRWIVTTRGATPAEAVAVATLEARRGRHHSAIGVLRRTLPELGTTAMDRAPEDAVRAYLPVRWEDELKSAAREFGLDPWLVAGVARQESVFEARARSPRGAIGVLQLLPSTARGHSLALGGSSRPDLNDPALNLRLGARELARLVRRFGAVEPALAAYNAGEGRASRWWKEWPERRAFTEAIPIPETYNYVRRVVFLAEAYRLVYGPLWRTQP
jgi:soluble lytic murein transglycosylase-like protein